MNPRRCKAVDTKFANELQNLPVVGSNNPVDRALAFRNLLRGNALSLPSGQDAAAALKTKYDAKIVKLEPDELEGLNPPLDEATPLFYYILAESEVRNGGERLGPVGSAILLEVFGGMLKSCKTSFVQKDASWNPDPFISKERLGWWTEKYEDAFDREKLIKDEHYYPFELADVAAYVDGD